MLALLTISLKIIKSIIIIVKPESKSSLKNPWAWVLLLKETLRNNITD